MKVFRLLVVLSLSLCAITVRGEEKPDYLNPELPLEKRVDDLVSRMTLEENWKRK